jgi:glycosyltransferase involved in cell wall biosynthesis
MANNLLVVSPFPPKEKYSHPKSALASFTYNLIENLVGIDPELKITILADTIPDSNTTLKSAHIVRCWTKNTITVFITLLECIYRYHSYKKVLIQFEWNVFGKGFYYLLSFPFLILALRILGKEPSIVVHGVLTDFSEITIEKSSPFSTRILSFFARMFYRILSLLSFKLIVLEEYLRKQLIDIGISPVKIETIAHGVDNSVRLIHQDAAKKKLHIEQDQKLLVFFGFLVPYKGPDILLHTIVPYLEKNPNSKLYLVGGESTNFAKDPEYKKFIKNIYELAENFPLQIVITGFIANDEISTYMSAADLLLFPYRTLLSSSGPLSLAYSFGKPFLLSEKLTNYQLSQDFKNSMETTHISPKDIFFLLNDSQDLHKKIDYVLKHETTFTQFSKIMKDQRDWKNIAEKYIKILSL